MDPQLLTVASRLLLGSAASVASALQVANHEPVHEPIAELPLFLPKSCIEIRADSPRRHSCPADLKENIVH